MRGVIATACASFGGTVPGAKTEILRLQKKGEAKVSFEVTEAGLTRANKRPSLCAWAGLSAPTGISVSRHRVDSRGGGFALGCTVLKPTIVAVCAFG